MKYSILACTEDCPEGKLVNNPLFGGQIKFATKDGAAVYARKMWEHSSLGVYFKIIAVDEGEEE